MVLRASSVLLTLGVSILLARTLGPAGYGRYAFVLALLALLGILSQSGLATLVVRETARAQRTASWPLLVGLWRWTSLVSLTLTAATAALAGLVLLLLGDALDPVLERTLLWGLLFLAFMGLCNLQGAAVRGLQRPILGQFPELIVRQSIFFLIVGGLVAAWPSFLTPDRAMAANAVATAIALGIAATMRIRVAPREVRGVATPQYQPGPWLRSMGPLALVAGLYVVSTNTDVVMLGLLAPSSEVGVYRVSVQGASLVAFGLQAVNLAVAPEMARLHTEGDRAGLQEVLRRGARLSAFVAVPASIVLIFFSGPILGLLFGEAFKGGANALRILAVGQLVNAAFGSVVPLLNMTGHERDTARGVAVAAGLNVLLNLILVPLFGIIGAAFATVFTIGVWNALLWRAAARRLGVSTLAYGRP